ncbi:endolytic transglycosylase MltG [Nocardioides zeae]|uniref:Endolytic murein transglycosylase n=1 Tax=Nocardioides imazamoxiresistens TaxID=3231893 RepID=A0ABU3Q0R6_9ACTN|nr:endolytic transglycosylase MltG [Nocardioides zeae]MDT9594615.1 endolytic transglycosylase MltG [Nocardioides zeae]
MSDPSPYRDRDPDRDPLLPGDHEPARYRGTHAGEYAEEHPEDYPDEHHDGYADEYADEHGEYAEHHEGYDEYAEGYHDDYEDDHRPVGSRRAERKRRGRGLGCLLVALVLVAAAAGLLYVGVSWVGDRLGGGEEAQDFEGVASVEECATGGEVDVEVPSGYGTSQIGGLLVEKGVVASSQVFVSAVGSGSIRDGARSMCEGMSGSQAAELLLENAYIGGGGITITAGQTKTQVFERLAGATGLAVDDFVEAEQDPSVPLPEGAGGDVEGYLFPGSYNFGVEPTAVDIVVQMVQRWQDEASEIGLVDDAVPGFTQHELLTVASIIEKEVLVSEERPAVAEVVYDRLAGTCEGVPAGLLQMDSTVNFLKGGSTGTPYTTDEDRQIDSPYNTYRYSGLPPGPIASPGLAAMEGAIDPTDEGYCYFVAANDGSNTSVFASGYAEHLENVRRAQGQ